MLRLFLSVFFLICMVPSLFGQQYPVADTVVSLNYALIRNDFLLNGVYKLSFIAMDDTGKQVEIDWCGYSPGHLLLRKYDYDKLIKCSNVILRFGTNENRYRYVGDITYFDVPLDNNVFDEEYVEIRVYDKTRVQKWHGSHYKKVKARLWDNGKSYVAAFYAGGRTSVVTLNWH